jgi:hypothetical protein
MSGRHSRGWAVVLIVVLTGMGLGLLGGITDGPSSNKGPETVFAIIAAGAIYFALFRGPVGKAIGKMLEGEPHGTDDDAVNRMYELESRLAELSADQQRVAELEERLDFAERLLSQRRDMPEFRTHRTPV